VGAAIHQQVHVAIRDQALIERSAAGERDAYDVLVRTRLDGLYHTALAILRHEADARDAVQDACVRAWRDLRSLREPSRFDAWLGRILVNECRGRLRSRRRVEVREIDLSAFGDGPQEATARGPSLAQHVVEVDAVRRAFLRLRAEERVLLALHHADGRSVDEIAELVGAPAGTVKWRLHSARKALAKALERER
jgi:RNA polymerase sigma-70 factor (ECF subfamily)